MSSLTHCSQVFLLLPRPLAPSTTNPLQADTQSSTLLRSRCPNHLNLPRLTTSATQLIPRRLHKSSLRLLSFKDTPHIHLTIIRSVLSKILRSSASVLTNWFSSVLTNWFSSVLTDWNIFQFRCIKCSCHAWDVIIILLWSGPGLAIRGKKASSSSVFGWPHLAAVGLRLATGFWCW